MWEYLSVVIKSKTSFWGGKFNNQEVNDELNDYGKKGWELVNVVAINKGSGSTEGLLAFFKRAK
ncbi:DUF4177 domain-containing protein [Acholeplasma sp. OttesenSCG-928-E16]|nr:DUF4177 domain-containing protein [Acholeplasma sp. OttesenSCG-928-E16]